MYPVDTVVQLAYDPGVKPNEGGLPGLSVLKQVMGSINLFGIIAVVGALAVSAGVWAWGHDRIQGPHRSSPTCTDRSHGIATFNSGSLMPLPGNRRDRRPRFYRPRQAALLIISSHGSYMRGGRGLRGAVANPLVRRRQPNLEPRRLAVRFRFHAPGIRQSVDE
jgi:hypothetical protein